MYLPTENMIFLFLKSNTFENIYSVIHNIEISSENSIENYTHRMIVQCNYEVIEIPDIISTGLFSEEYYLIVNTSWTTVYNRHMTHQLEYFSKCDSKY